MEHLTIKHNFKMFILTQTPCVIYSFKTIAIVNWEATIIVLGNILI